MQGQATCPFRDCRAFEKFMRHVHPKGLGPPASPSDAGMLLRQYPRGARELFLKALAGLFLGAEGVEIGHLIEILLPDLALDLHGNNPPNDSHQTCRRASPHPNP